MAKCTITGTFELPSKGLIYDVPVNPNIELRSILTEDEMKATSYSASRYKSQSDIIEACIEGDKPQVHVYDMHLGDYQFLLQKLRTVTHGSSYPLEVQCPVCGRQFTSECNLDELEVLEFEEELSTLNEFELPMTGKRVKIHFQTPRMLDEIEKRKSEILKKSPEMTYDPTLMITLQAIIDIVDGQKMAPAALEKFVRSMPMRDANIIMKKAIKLNESIGVSPNYSCTCPSCGFEMIATFRATPEFFSPSID